MLCKMPQQPPSTKEKSTKEKPFYQGKKDFYQGKIYQGKTLEKKTIKERKDRVKAQKIQGKFRSIFSEKIRDSKKNLSCQLRSADVPP